MTTQLKKSATVTLPTKYGDFIFMCYKEKNTGKEHLALIQGNIQTTKAPLVRIHSECATGDIFSSLKCDCGDQLDLAMSLIAKEGAGMIIYLRQEGRGIGIENKIKAYTLQEKGLDTVEANEKLGFPADCRTYEIAAFILKDHKIPSVRLMTNNPAKIKGLQDHNIEVKENIPIKVPTNPHNQHYISIKRKKMDHL